MPRPKRTKVAPAASRAHPPIPQRATSDPIEDVFDIPHHDRADKIKVSRVKSALPSAYQTSRLESGARGRTSATKAARSKDLEIQAQRRDNAMLRLEAENDTSSTGRQSLARDTTSASKSPEVEVSRRERGRSETCDSGLSVAEPRLAPLSVARGRGRVQRSESVESELAESTGLYNRPRKEGSVLGLGGVRRRPRQPSILGRRARSSSIGLDMTPAHTTSVLGARRRMRQPSILGRRQQRQESENLENADDFGDEADFAPEDESTPLNISKSRSQADTSPESEVSMSRGRKRKSTSLEEPVSSPAPMRNASIPPASSDVEASDAELPPPDAIRYETPELFSETMAPPQSSSSPASDVLPSPPQIRRGRAPARAVQQSTRQQPTRRQVVAVMNDDSPPSSPPSLTHSPDRPTRAAARRTTRAAPDPSKLSTQQLQALLPRRRRRARDTFAIESDDEAVDTSALGPEDDELSHLNVRSTNRRTPAVPRRVTKLKAPKNKDKATYGTHQSRSSNEENADEEHDPNDSLGPIADTEPENSQELEERVGKELKKAKRKFETVDKWELEFEECTASSDGPWDAR